MLSPLPRRSHWRYCFAHSSSRISLPRKGSRVGLRIVLFEACSAFTRVTACTLALSPIRDTLNRRLQPFRYLHDCSGCFRLERLPGGTYTHWKSAALSYHDSAACLLKDGVLVAAAPARFSRRKNDPRFPVDAALYCLEEGDLSISEVDCVAYYENPIKKLERQVWSRLPLVRRDPNELARLDPFARRRGARRLDISAG